MNQVSHSATEVPCHSFIYCLVGMHQLDVTYENVPVSGSPFRVNAVSGYDATRVRAYGPGLEGATTNEPTTFTIETKGAGQGSLGLAIEGPSEAKMVCKDNQDGTCIMEYLPVRDEDKQMQGFFMF